MKTGLIVEGGGMKDAYNAGVIDAFLDHGITFDYVSGVSAGATCAASYLARQRGRNRRFFTTHPTNPEYFGLKAFLSSGDFFNLHYIYDTLTNEDGADPLDIKALLAGPEEFVFVATNAETGEPVYLTKKDIVPNDYRCFKATCALPVLCHPVELNGMKLFDGGVSDSLPYVKAIENGVDRLVIILSKPLDFVMEPQKHMEAINIILHKYPKTAARLKYRYKMYNRQHATMMKLYKEGRIFLFAPKEKLSTYTMDINVLDGMYREGLSDGNERLDAMEKYLSGPDMLSVYRPRIEKIRKEKEKKQ